MNLSADIGSRTAEARAGTPVARVLHRGPDWCISEYVCSAGPGDRPFEEQHADVSVAAVVAGSFRYRSDAAAAVLHPGALLLGNCGACFECSHNHGKEDRRIAFHFSPAYLAEVAARHAGTSRFKFPTVMLPALPELLPWVARLESQAAATDPLELDEVLPRLLASLIGILSGTRPLPVKPSAFDERRISEVLRHIEGHASDSLDLTKLAAVATMSKYHFPRTFERTVGMPPYRYLLSVRLRRTAVRLSTSSEAVSKIAFEAGFGDLSTFNGRFRATFGVSPTAYRKGAWTQIARATLRGEPRAGAARRR